MGMVPAFAQFDVKKVELRLGYHLHNAYAKRFNALIDDFNNSRYPLEIQENLGSINFLHGFVLGGNYYFRDDMYLQAVLKNKHQFLQAKYVEPEMYRSYLFRENTLEMGASYNFRNEKGFSHYAGTGLILGYMSVLTDWSESSKRAKNRDMLNISTSMSLGLSFSYEAQFYVTNHFRIFLRPNAQFTLNSFIRNLDSFMDPQLDDTGAITYPTSEGVKVNKGSLSGYGMEGGILLSLP